MSDWSIEQPGRRGLLLMAAAAGVSLAAPRMLRAAAGKSDSKFGGDLSAVRAAIEKQQAEALKRLQNWIALPSIAAENRPDEYYVIESSNPAVHGMAEATLSYVRHLYALAAI
jgi:hypothetical protein